MKKVFALMKSETNLIVRRIIAKKGKSFLRVYEGNQSDKFKKRPINELTMAGSKVIRWGNRIEAETDKTTIVYNKSEAIEKATDKKRSRELFIKGKVRTPALVTPTTIGANQYPVIARPSRHAKGKNFVVLTNQELFSAHYAQNSNAGWYYSEFINKEREFRVHCAHGKILAVMEKARGGDKIAWNRAVTGEPFTRVQTADYPFSVCFQALKAVKTLGLDFAGVDVLLLGKDGIVLEVNTSPTLNSSDHVSTMYAKYFDWLNRSDKRREHWDFTKFKSAESFQWKNFQLDETANPGKNTTTTQQ
jgi:glutathione synthase/RimK-type ligase-like ATP-grasp enzyme